MTRQHKSDNLYVLDSVHVKDNKRNKRTALIFRHPLIFAETVDLPQAGWAELVCAAALFG